MTLESLTNIIYMKEIGDVNVIHNNQNFYNRMSQKNDEANVLNYLFKYILIILGYKLMWGKVNI